MVREVRELASEMGVSFAKVGRSSVWQTISSNWELTIIGRPCFSYNCLYCFCLSFLFFFLVV